MAVVELPSSAVVRILAIEDNPRDVALVRIALQDAGLPFDLDVIEDGEQAISRVQRTAAELGGTRPDIVLLDLNLPCRDGIEVLRAIRGCAHLEGISVAVLTSSDAPRDRARATAGGANRYIVKPARLGGWVSYNLLVSAIRELCPRLA